MITNRYCLNWHSIAIIVVFTCTYVTAKCQTVTGIFLNEKDFKNNIASFSKHHDPKYKIKIRSAFPNKKIKVKYGKITYYLKKDSVYGYITKNLDIRRFYGKTEYTLLNYGEEIQLYKLQISMQTKYQKATFGYFFSCNYGSEIKALTIVNLLKTFKDNNQFTTMIELRYRSDNELIEYDPYHKKYKLNRLLELSKN